MIDRTIALNFLRFFFTSIFFLTLLTFSSKLIKIDTVNNFLLSTFLLLTFSNVPCFIFFKIMNLSSVSYYLSKMSPSYLSDSTGTIKLMVLSTISLLMSLFSGLCSLTLFNNCLKNIIILTIDLNLSLFFFIFFSIYIKSIKVISFLIIGFSILSLVFFLV